MFQLDNSEFGKRWNIRNDVFKTRIRWVSSMASARLNQEYEFTVDYSVWGHSAEQNETQKFFPRLRSEDLMSADEMISMLDQLKMGDIYASLFWRFRWIEPGRVKFCGLGTSRIEDVHTNDRFNDDTDPKHIDAPEGDHPQINFLRHYCFADLNKGDIYKNIFFLESLKMDPEVTASEYEEIPSDEEDSFNVKIAYYCRHLFKEGMSGGLVCRVWIFFYIY